MCKGVCVCSRVCVLCKGKYKVVKIMVCACVCMFL